MEVLYGNDSFDGVNHYLFARHNFRLQSEIKVLGDKYGNFTNPIYVFDPNIRNSNWASKERNKSIPLTVEYFNYMIHLTTYTIQTRTDLSENLPKGWDLHGSFDGITWDLLHTISDSKDLLTIGAYNTYECLNKGSYRYFRFNMTEENTGNPNGNYHFHINKIEFFGTITSYSNPFIQHSCINTNNYRYYFSLLLISIVK